MNNSKNNLTEGNLPLQVLLFTLPLMSTLFIQQLYSSADLVFAGNFLGKEASAAIGGSTFLVSSTIGLFYRHSYRCRHPLRKSDWREAKGR